MILLVHLLFGAATGNLVKNPILAIILAFLGHYILDFLPHIEYSIENISKNQWRKALPDITRVTLDLCLGLLLIFLFSKNQPIIYVCAFFAILPDGLSLLNNITKIQLLKTHSDFHHEKLHFLKNKKISIFWRVSSQLIVEYFLFIC